MSAAPLLMTLDEYLKTPETVKPAELAYGVLRVCESPTATHQSMVLELLLALDAHVRARSLGRMWVAPLDVVLDADRALVVQPDLFFISRARDWIVRDRVYGAPDLIIEVLSPNPRIGDTDERVGWFAEHGVRECWLVDQSQVSVTVIQFANGAVASRRTFGQRDKLESAVLPELTSSLDDVLNS